MFPHLNNIHLHYCIVLKVNYAPNEYVTFEILVNVFQMNNEK